MDTYIKSLEVRWADLDPNFHVLHSRYLDYGAYCRMSFFVENGIDPAFMASNHIGPILFREECIFKKELKFGDEVSISLKLQKHKGDFSRWSVVHEIFKNKNTLAAIINADGAWMDVIERKLTIPPPKIISIFALAPKADDYLVY